MSSAPPIEVDAPTVHAWLGQRDDLVLIDCREESEFVVAKIPGAVLMPMSKWADASSKLDGLHGKHLVVHCHHGVRSLRVVNWLRSNGFPDAQSMIGGIDAWSEQVDATVPRY